MDSKETHADYKKDRIPRGERVDARNWFKTLPRAKEFLKRIQERKKDLGEESEPNGEP